MPDTALEVVETHKVTWVPEEHLLDVAFVLHIDAVNEGKYTAAGMCNACYIRCNQSTETLEKDWESFKALYKKLTNFKDKNANCDGFALDGETYSKRMIKYLMMVVHTRRSNYCRTKGSSKERKNTVSGTVLIRRIFIASSGW